MAKEIKVDVDKAIEIYNSKHPNERITSRTQFVNMLNTDVSLMTLDNLKNGKNVPKSFNVVFEMAHVCDCDVYDFLEIKYL